MNIYISNGLYLYNGLRNVFSYLVMDRKSYTSFTLRPFPLTWSEAERSNEAISQACISQTVHDNHGPC